MNNNINLLDYKSKATPAPSSKKQKLLRKIAIGFLFASATLSVIFFMLISFSPLPDLEKQRQRASANLALQDKEIAKLTLVRERADNIKTLMDKRSRYDEVLGKFQDRLPSGATIESVQMKNKNFSVVISSRSLLILNNFLEQLAKGENTSDYSKVRLADLSINTTDGNFYATLNIETL